MKPIKNIKRLINEFHITTSAKLDQKISQDVLEVMRRSKQTTSAAPESSIWRLIMNKPITKLAVAAMIIIAVMIGLNITGGPDMAGVAWADLAEKLERIQTCVFRGRSTSIMPTPNNKDARETEATMYVSSEYGFRSDTYSNGKLETTQYILPAEQVVISVMHEQKKYMRLLLTDEHKTKMHQQGMGDPREMIKQFMALEYVELGRNTIDGIEVDGIETNDPKYFGGMLESSLARLWVDIQTELPIRIEMEMQMGFKDSILNISMIMDEFEWDVELEASIFEPNIPNDYTLLAEMKMPNQDEGGAVTGLRLFAEITDGKYPSSMNTMRIIKEVMETMKDSFDGDPNSKPSQEDAENMAKNIMPKIVTAQGAGLFYAELVKADKDPAYFGDKVTSEDTDAVLMRWKISDDEYRVIFGDLTAENISTEQLEQLEAEQSE